jgi:hypothetical protein
VIGAIFYFSPERGPLPGLASPPSLEEIARAARIAQQLGAVAPPASRPGVPGAAGSTVPPLRDTLSTIDRHIPWRGEGTQAPVSPGQR